MLGENNDVASGGVSIHKVRSTLRPYIIAPLLVIACRMIPTILQDICLMTFTAEQVDALMEGIESTSSLSSGALVPYSHTYDLVASAPPNPKYELMNAAELRHEIEIRDNQLAAAHTDNKRRKRKERYASNRCDALTQQLVERDRKVEHL